MRRSWAVFLVGFLLAGSIWAVHGQDAVPAPGAILLRECALDYERSTQVGAISDGSNGTVFQECLAKLGDRVQAGQVLGRLQNRDLQLELMQAKATAENMIEINNCEALYTQAKLQARQGAALMEKRAIGTLEYNLLVCNEKVAAIAIDRARFARTVAELQHQQTAVQFRNRDFRAPHDGVVVEVFKHEGERMMAGEAAFVVVDDSQILVTGNLDVGDAFRVRQGHKARVMPDIEGAELPIEREIFEGQVIFVDNRIDPLSKTCKVIVRVANRENLLRSGLVARMEIRANEETAPLMPVRSSSPQKTDEAAIKQVAGR